MMRLAVVVRMLHDREPFPSMVMVDAQTVKGARYGPTFHEAGGPGGRTRGTKRTLLVDILGLPVAARMDSARPHDVQAGRELLRERISSGRASGRWWVIVPTGASPRSPGGGTWRSTSRPHRRAWTRPRPSGRCTRWSTPSPSWAAGGACRDATRAPPRAPGPGSRSRRSATSPGAPPSDRSPVPEGARPSLTVTGPGSRTPTGAASTRPRPLLRDPSPIRAPVVGSASCQAPRVIGTRREFGHRPSGRSRPAAWVRQADPGRLLGCSPDERSSERRARFAARYPSTSLPGGLLARFDLLNDASDA